MPIDEENLIQYSTHFSCPDCGEHTFQTDAEPVSLMAFVEAECTNCGHALTGSEIEQQKTKCPPSDIQAMMSKYRAAL